MNTIKITDELKARIRDHEGCVDTMYLDSLGKATVGIGHLVQPHERERFAEGVEIPMDEILELFEMDLNRAAAGADMLIQDNIGHDLPQHVGEVILEMVFQLGTTGVSKFKKMWKAKLVHGDLSEYNILNNKEKFIVIDLSHGIPSSAPASRELFERDIKNVVKYFNKRGLDVEEEKVHHHLDGRYPYNRCEHRWSCHGTGFRRRFSIGFIAGTSSCHTRDRAADC